MKMRSAILYVTTVGVLIINHQCHQYCHKLIPIINIIILSSKQLMLNSHHHHHVQSKGALFMKRKRRGKRLL